MSLKLLLCVEESLSLTKIAELFVSFIILPRNISKNTVVRYFLQLNPLSPVLQFATYRWIHSRTVPVKRGSSSKNGVPILR